MTESNSHTLRITGECELPHSLDQEKEYKITVTGQVDAIEKKNQHDGSYEFRHKFRLLTAELIEEGGKIVKLIDKTKMSVKFRKLLEDNHAIRSLDGDSENYYKAFMKFLMSPEIIEPLLDKFQWNEKN